MVRSYVMASPGRGNQEEPGEYLTGFAHETSGPSPTRRPATFDGCVAEQQDPKKGALCAPSDSGRFVFINEDNKNE